MSRGEELAGELIDCLLGEKLVEQNKRPSFLYGLELDYYLPNLQLAFEFQGEQHFQMTDFYTKDTDLLKRLFYDVQKDILCNRNGIILVRINARTLIGKQGIRILISKSIQNYYNLSLSLNRSACPVLPVNLSTQHRRLFKIIFSCKNIVNGNWDKKTYFDLKFKTKEYIASLINVFGHKQYGILASTNATIHFRWFFNKIQEKYGINKTIDPTINLLIKSDIKFEDILKHAQTMMF